MQAEVQVQPAQLKKLSLITEASALQRGELLSVWQDTREQSQENDNLTTVSG